MTEVELDLPWELNSVARTRRLSANCLASGLSFFSGRENIQVYEFAGRGPAPTRDLITEVELDYRGSSTALREQDA